MNGDRTGPRSPRGTFGLLIDPVFGPFFAGKLLSTTGVWIHNIVASILAYQLTQSAFVVGCVSVAQFAPQLVLSPYSGAIADRGNRRRQVVAGRLVVTLGTGGLAFALWTRGEMGLGGPAPVIAAALVVGIGFVIGGPAMHALIPSMVHRSELAAAVSLTQFPFTLARAGGPALGALVAVNLGLAWAFTLAAVCNLTFALIVLFLPLAPQGMRPLKSESTIRLALNYIRSDSALSRMLVAVAAIGVGVDPAITLTPPLSDFFGQGAELVGTFASAFGLGAATAYFVLGTTRRHYGTERLATLGLLLMSAGMAGIAMSPSPRVATAAFAIAGGGMIAALTSLSTLIQERLVDSLRGRVMAFWSVAFVGSRPIAAAVNGFIADEVSVQSALVVVAVVIAAAAWFCRPSRMTAQAAAI